MARLLVSLSGEVEYRHSTREACPASLFLCLKFEDIMKLKYTTQQPYYSKDLWNLRLYLSPARNFCNHIFRERAVTYFKQLTSLEERKICPLCEADHLNEKCRPSGENSRDDRRRNFLHKTIVLYHLTDPKT